MRYNTIFIAICALCLVACNNTGPSSPDFLITSIEFTGDSTGLESKVKGTLSVPFC